VTTGDGVGQDLLRRLYPEVGAGGFSRCDGTVEFWSRVQALVSPAAHVLDLGAGRGRGPAEDGVAWRRDLQSLRGRAERVVGLDVDPAVRDNPALDRALVYDGHEPFPFDDETFDLVVSDFTFEHLDRPATTAAEVDRVLRPGGWLCARTPNRWGYIGVGGRLVPNVLHRRVLPRLQPVSTRREDDVFPTRYRLNTQGDLRRAFPPARWQHHTYVHHPEPLYFGSSNALWRTVRRIGPVLPDVVAPVLLIFVQKREPEGPVG
jgi:SAM-dependent methyltransferase